MLLRSRAMKALVIHEYGGPEVMKFEEAPDPTVGVGEVLVRMHATSFNPFDMKRRSGEAKEMAPIKFPGIVGVDLAGTVIELGSGVNSFAVGDSVFGMADQTYAELCVVKASQIARIPTGIDPIEAAALPLVTTTGHTLISLGTDINAGQTVLVTGAVGNVGRSAVFTAKGAGAVVIAGVLTKQLEQARSLGADQIVATDDDSGLANLPLLDAVADTVNGKTAEKLIAKIKPGGVFASVVGIPQNSTDYPKVKFVPVNTLPDAKVLLFMAQAVISGQLTIPIGQKVPLRDAAEVHAGRGQGSGKVLLVMREG